MPIDLFRFRTDGHSKEEILCRNILAKGLLYPVGPPVRPQDFLGLSKSSVKDSQVRWPLLVCFVGKQESRSTKYWMWFSGHVTLNVPWDLCFRNSPTGTPPGTRGHNLRYLTSTRRRGPDSHPVWHAHYYLTHQKGHTQGLLGVWVDWSVSLKSVKDGRTDETVFTSNVPLELVSSLIRKGGRARKKDCKTNAVWDKETILLPELWGR